MPKSDAVPHGQSHHYCSPHSDVLGWVIERAGNDSFANQFSNSDIAAVITYTRNALDNTSGGTVQPTDVESTVRLDVPLVDVEYGPGYSHDKSCSYE